MAQYEESCVTFDIKPDQHLFKYWYVMPTQNLYVKPEIGKNMICMKKKKIIYYYSFNINDSWQVNRLLQIKFANYNVT